MSEYTPYIAMVDGYYARKLGYVKHYTGVGRVKSCRYENWLAKEVLHVQNMLDEVEVNNG